MSLQNYKNITKLRLAYISRATPNLSHFTVFVRSIPSVSPDSYSDSVKKFFSKYYASSYLSHQMVHRCGKIYKLMVCIFVCYSKFLHACLPVDFFLHLLLCFGFLCSYTIFKNSVTVAKTSDLNIWFMTLSYLC